MWSTAQREKRIYTFDDHGGFVRNYCSVGHGKRCLLALDFEFEGQRKKGRSKEEREVKGRKGG